MFVVCSEREKLKRENTDNYCEKNVAQCRKSGMQEGFTVFIPFMKGI